MTTAEDRELYRVTAQVRKARRLVKALTAAGFTEITPTQILASSDEWRRAVEEYAGVSSPSSDTTWSIVACLLEEV